MKIGLEIHQRLNTGKLFCRCPSNSKGLIKGMLYRKLHIVKSELGEKDVAAIREELKDKTFEYAVYDNSCLVECDEEPPHDINPAALRVAVAVARYLNLKLVDQIFVMRKMVIDGSNTSGFQRTALVGLDGKLKNSKGDVGIQALFIEEESAGIMNTEGKIAGGPEGKRAMFGLNRLGVPLIEIATAPDIIDGVHAKEVAESLGMMLRMTGMAARGIGTIRQDLNISVEGGAKVEIKGVQELDDIPIIIEKEVQRQHKLIEINGLIRENKPEELRLVDATQAFRDGKGWLHKAIAGGSKAVGVVLPGLKGVLGIELYAGRRFGTELSDYAKTFGFGGIIHGDEDFSKYGVDKAGVERMFPSLKDNDSYAILIGNDERKMRLAFEAIIERAYLKRVPRETRKAVAEGGSQYMRPMATGARMYPETDVESILVDQELIDDSTQYLPKDYNELLKTIEGQTNGDVARQIIKSKYLELYLDAVSLGIDPMIVATTITNTWVSLSRDGLDIESLDDEKKLTVLTKNKDGVITKKAIEEVFRQLCRSPSKSVDEAIRENNLSRISGEELKKVVEKEGGSVQAIMAKYRLRVDAEELMKMIGKK